MMNKFLVFILALLILALPDGARAGVRYDDTEIVIDDTNLYPKTDGGSTLGKPGNEFAGLYVDSITTAGDVTFKTNLLSLGRVSASSSLASSSTSVGSTSVPYAYVRKFLGAGAEATTLPNGTPGQVLNLTVVTSVGGVWTITPTQSMLVTSFTMTAVDDSITLLYLNDVLGWMVLGAEGSTAITYNVIK